MPIYTCTIRELTLDIDTKAALAGEMARIHSSINRVPSTSVDVDFHELSVDNVYTGRRREDVLRNRRRHAEPHRLRHRSERDRLGPRTTREGGRLRCGRGSAAHWTAHGLCGNLRALQSRVSMRPIAIALRSS